MSDFTDDILIWFDEHSLIIVVVLAVVLIIGGALWYVSSQPKVTPTVIPTWNPTFAPTPTPTPTPLPDGCVYMTIPDGNGGHKQIVYMLTENTPALYAALTYGLDAQGFPLISPFDIPCYVQPTHYYTAIGYYNITLRSLIYYFLPGQLEMETTVSPYADSSYEQARNGEILNYSYAVLPEIRIVDGRMYARDNLGVYVALSNMTFNPVMISDKEKLPKTAGELDIRWSYEGWDYSGQSWLPGEGHAVPNPTPTPQPTVPVPPSPPPIPTVAPIVNGSGSHG